MVGGRRVLLSVSPRMLSDALVEVLDAEGIGELVVVRPGEAPTGTFDGAIVTPDASPVHADVVIELPQVTGSSVTVHSADADEVIDLRDTGGLIDLLDQHLGRPG